MKSKLAVGVVIGVLVMAASVLPASARWAFGNGATDLDVSAGPDPAFPGLLCANRIQGRAGSQSATGPWAPITVEVYTGAPGDLGGARGLPGGGLELISGVVIQPVATVTTATPTALDPPEPYDGYPDTIYAAASFDIAIPDGVLKPGDDVAVKKASYGAIKLGAVTIGTPTTCPPKPTDPTPPTTIAATVDVLPGINTNYVVPTLKASVLPVRLFGSATLDVTKVASIKVGNAAPATVPAWLAPLFAPKDRNGDGFADRDVLVSPAATGITCSSTSVAVTGTLVGGQAFAGSDSVRPIAC